MRKNYIPLSLTYTLTFINKNNVFDFQSIKNFYIYIHNDIRLYELKSIYNFASEKDTQDINRPKPSNLLNSDGDSSPTVPCNGTITLHTKKGVPCTHMRALFTHKRLLFIYEGCRCTKGTAQDDWRTDHAPLSRCMPLEEHKPILQSPKPS